MAQPFPSLVIRADGLHPQGSFAEAQAAFLEPDPETVSELRALLEAGQVGVAAHFYMDAELQGVLTACDWPWIRISDSLAMADAAVKMVEEGARAVVVLGVDFMSENVRAVLDAAGHAEVPVLRVSDKEIGCSLAESAEALAYGAWLTKAAARPRSLHVIYINTSLAVKARSHRLVPTITCTSSNVVRTLLQAASQVPKLEVWYGPDTYMGENLQAMFSQLAAGDDEAVRALHPDHDAASVAALLERMHVFPQGNCVVHHMFGAEVVEQVRRDHPDAFHTAHLEVPGEMFALAAQAQREGRGVVGSTSNILGFIQDKLTEALAADEGGRLSFVLGTEAGMITSIVDRISTRLAEAGRGDLEVEIIFPVASEAVAAAPDSELAVLPGVAGGEGCSTAGGCATCPYMKMNSLDALLMVLEGVRDGRDLSAFTPRTWDETLDGRTLAELGTEPILHMRAFQATGRLPEDLIDRVSAG